MKPVYTPRVVEIEMSHKCNLRCPGCAILGDIKADKHTLETDQILDFIQQMADCGLEAYGLTGGEPFLFLPRVLEIIEKAPIDLLKMDTNGFAFSSLELSQKIWQKFKAINIHKSKKIKSWIYISMGQQNIEGIPIQNAVNAAITFEETFSSDDQVGFGVNVFSPTNEHALNTLETLQKLYKEQTGQEFDAESHILKHIPSEGQICSTAFTLGNVFNQTMSIRNLIYYYLYEQKVSLNCVSEEVRTATRYVSPRMLLRADGTLYVCPGFSHVHKLGDIFETPLAALLAKANQDKVISTVFRGGLLRLLELAEEYEPGIGQKKISISNGPCDVCRILSKSIGEYSL